jgi:hypothetical protein
LINKGAYISMKKTIYSSLLTGLTALTSITAVEAVPLYYKFDGVLDDLYYKGMKITNQYMPGLSRGDPASYVFFVDDTVPSEVRTDGTIIDYGFTVSEQNIDSYSVRTLNFIYQATLLSGTGLIIDEKNTVPGRLIGNIHYSTSGTPLYSELWPMNFLYFSGSATNGSIEMDTWPTPVYINQPDMESYMDFAQWASQNYGIACYSFLGACALEVEDDKSNNYIYHPWVHLTSISENNPITSVSEPSVRYLLGVSLAGIGVVRARKLLKNYRGHSPNS